jgi:hypothetical protein
MNAPGAAAFYAAQSIGGNAINKPAGSSKKRIGVPPAF